ncbi:MAG: hypothetical protein HY210_00075 [Candidatus Omnitrophica bacterium]|nr:hypothetical protein [Candidatus Omnitrophota bacterium]MBI5023397.1 hypothetical protein [Candidatus Omnitrophota bacterium]
MRCKQMIFLFAGRLPLGGVLFLSLWTAGGCTVKAVGDPNRPITINAHVTVDIRGLKNTATDIEDYVSGAKPKESLPTDKGGK